MGIQAHDKRIDDFAINVTQFDGRYAFKLKMRLLKLIAPIASGTIGGIGGGNLANLKDVMNASFDFSKIGSSIETLFTSLSEDQAYDLIIAILRTTRINGKEVSKEDAFNDIFSGNLSLMYKVILFVLEVNYKDLFKMGSIGNLIKKMSTNQTILPENMNT
jgi:hypothetical protein